MASIMASATLEDLVCPGRAPRRPPRKALEPSGPSAARPEVAETVIKAAGRISRSTAAAPPRGTVRRGGDPLGSGEIASSNQCICHVRLKRSGVWEFEARSHERLARRCATYTGTFDQVLAQHRQEKFGA
jgi:hypothetical protein